MPIRFDSVYWMSPFVKQLEKLSKSQPRLRTKLWRITDQYLEDIENLPDRTPLRGNARKKIWHTDINAGNAKRLIDEQLEGEFRGCVAFLYLGHHDDANSYGEHYDRDTERDIRNNRALLAYTPVAAAVPAQATRTAETGARRGRTANSYGEFLKIRQLRRLGIEEPTAGMALQRPTSVGLEGLGLSPEQISSVESLYLAALPVSTIVPPVPGLAAPGPLQVTRETLPSILRLPLSRFLAQLSDAQARLATRENRGLYVVRGAAGSGKTIVGIRRIEHWLAQRDLFDERPILFVCYNNVLRQVAEQLIGATIGKDPASARVEVTTIYRLLGRLGTALGVDGKRGRLELVDETRLLPALAVARVEAGSPAALSRWSDAAILKEIREVIYGRALPDVEAYIGADRTGRGREYALDDRGRRALWDVYTAFRARCKSDNIAPWEHLPARFLSYLRKNPPTTPRYAGIVIDEVQDLTPAAVQALVALQAGQTDNILVLGDAAQNVFGSGFRWKHLGLRVTGAQVNTLRQCFRSTAPIVEAAVPLVSPQQESLEDDLVLPVASADEEAPAVTLRLYASSEIELDEVAYQVAERIEEGVPPSAIGILLDDEARRSALGARLAALDCRFEDYLKRTDRRVTKSIDVTEPSVKLLSTGSAKGLEFQVLFIPGVTEARFPGAAQLEDASLARRELYTAMMRCGWDLRLSAVAGEASSLLDHLGPVNRSP